MALLCRAVGVPARVVSGFLDGEFNDAGNFYLVRQEDAHAWVEAYFPGEGWLSFDPSPVALDRAARKQTSVLALLKGYWESYKLLWDQYILTYNLWDQFYAAMELASALRQAREAIAEFGSQLLHALARARLEPAHAVPWVVGVAAFIVLLRVVWRRRGTSITAAFGLAGQRSSRLGRASRAYERFLREAARRGFQKRDSETPIEFAQRLSSVQPEACRELTDLYYSVRFGDSEPRDFEAQMKQFTKLALSPGDR
jgi:hypothetical protein